MRIVHVVSSLAVGGAEWVALRLAAMQRADGLDAEVLSLRAGPLFERAREMGIPVWAASARRLRLAGEVALRFARRRPDIVNSHNPSAHRFARLSRVAGHAPLVCTRHGELWQWDPAPSLFDAPFTDGVIAVSRRVREAFLRDYPGFPPRRLVTIENGVAPPQPGGGEPLAALRRPGHTLLYLAARLDPVKDLSTMLRAVARVRSAHPVQLVLAGDGPERGRLEQEARALGIEGDVTFLGFRGDAARLYPAADVFVLSSISEGMSLSVLEAMAAGLPVVATSVGSNPELVDEGRTGLLVPARDADALAAAITRLCADPGLRERMGAAGRVRVEERYSLQRTARRYLGVYQRLLSSRAIDRALGRVSIDDQ